MDAPGQRRPEAGLARLVRTHGIRLRADAAQLDPERPSRTRAQSIHPKLVGVVEAVLQAPKAHLRDHIFDCCEAGQLRNPKESIG